MGDEIKYFYSMKVPGLYRSDMSSVIESAGLTDADLVEITEELYLNAINPPEGKQAIFDDQGLRLEDLPAPDYQLIAQEEKQSLIDSATQSITVWQTKLLIGRKLTDAETASLNAWMDYIDVLNDTDISDAPDVQWPTKPE